MLPVITLFVSPNYPRIGTGSPQTRPPQTSQNFLILAPFAADCFAKKTRTRCFEIIRRARFG
jgi:hypothetical protein